MQPGERVRSRGGGGEVRCVDVPVDRLALPTNAPVVVDTEVSADADEPGLKVGEPVKRVERLVELQEYFLTQIFSLLVSADEFVGDIENSPVVGVDDLVSGRLIPAKARLDESIRGTGLGGRGVHGYAGERWRGTGRRNHSKPFFGLLNIRSVQCRVRRVVERSVDRDVRPAVAVTDV